jgi:glutaryl-CoA dehydrogenase
MAAYRAIDYYDLDDQFSEEELMVRDTVRSWVSDRFLPVIMEHYEAGTAARGSTGSPTV